VNKVHQENKGLRVSKVHKACLAIKARQGNKVLQVNKGLRANKALRVMAETIHQTHLALMVMALQVKPRI
jgi:hypothetical protein